MKNRSCPDKIACWDYDAGNCEGCAVGNLILRQKKSIKRLKSELERYKRALRLERYKLEFLQQVEREIEEERK